ncbi:MAG: phytoene/squalene synthase family protein [Oceanipulchritudo sp.]
MSTVPASCEGYRMPMDSRVILRRHGKSFYFAGQFLAGKQLIDCSRLYAFCRYLDDIADCSAFPGQARRVLEKVYEDISNGSSREPIVNDFLHLADSHAIDKRIVLELIHGLKGDLEPVEIRNWSQLLLYCYRAAGTVGLLMSRILGADDPEARFHAIDLGVAMQLTNIARDVAEDARAGRRYIPAELLPGLPPGKIADPDKAARPLLQRAVEAILATADCYYASGEAGLAYLPARPRLAILIASRVYRAIGSELRRNHCVTWKGRAFISGRRKALIASRTIVHYVVNNRYRACGGGHEACLHRAFAGMPEAHCKGIPA